MTYEEALQIAKEELDEKIEYLSDTFKGYSARIESYIYNLSMARKALIQALEEKREWVGLTREEEAVIIEQWHTDEGKPSQLCRIIEAKLKEKNT